MKKILLTILAIVALGISAHAEYKYPQSIQYVMVECDCTTDGDACYKAGVGIMKTSKDKKLAREYFKNGCKWGHNKKACQKLKSL